jgi:hypothetical protein
LAEPHPSITRKIFDQPLHTDYGLKSQKTEFEAASIATIMISYFIDH